MGKSFPHYAQLDSMDCGPTCLRMISKFYGRSYSLQTLRERTFVTTNGASMYGICQAAESIGFRTSGVKLTLDQLRGEASLPCILHWNHKHFVVLYSIDRRNYHISDPACGRCKVRECDFIRCWCTEDALNVGVALLLEPTPRFYQEDEEKGNNEHNVTFFFRYLRPYTPQLIQLFVGMITLSMLQLLVPFLTQSMVDVGIGQYDLHFITLVLIAQLCVFVAQLLVEFIRDRIVLNVNSRINIALISDFLAKLMRLPIRYFDTKRTGDILQRIGDHSRIEAFMTGQSMGILFSFFNFIVYGLILAYYNTTILMVFLLGNSLYVLWVLYFMRYRRELDMRRFTQSAGEQSSLIQLVSGMQEIKLNNCETQKRWQWEHIQASLFKINLKSLSIGQYQQAGSLFFSQSTNILISFLSAEAVVRGDMTMGMMTSLSYIVGQLSSPVNQVISFSQTLQDAKISLERLNEVHAMEDEDHQFMDKSDVFPKSADIHFEHVCFGYDGVNNVLDDICLDIPYGKITAIVGASGSGKTTLLKMLLGFYFPDKGAVRIGKQPLQNVNPHVWRRNIGAVMQDGFIFSDTVKGNIAVGTETVDMERLVHAADAANIREFIENLPCGYDTKIGMDGNGISQGQRQRILIARAIYKDPQYLFFDEATNSLDANNEKEIMAHLKSFCQGRTVVVAAHRLSTILDADSIVVLDNGKIIEKGTHRDLVEHRGKYYDLVRNQLGLRDD